MNKPVIHPDLTSLVRDGMRFPTLYADPAWPFETWSEKGKQRSPERHYATMPLAAIKRLPVGELAAKNCALFLWTTCPHLAHALEVISAWGFVYKTVAFTWSRA
jgi:N6-adenosine-specific RNA methylase IME4